MSDEISSPPTKTHQQASAEQDAGLEQTLSDLSASMEHLLTETMESLSLRGIDAYDLAPLMKLRDAIRILDGVASAAPPALAPDKAGAHKLGHYGRDGWREDLEASENVLARASAIIDLLVLGGQSPEHAAQIITRQLLVVGIKLPSTNGDARAWKRLFNWRNSLIHYKRSGPAWDTYCSFKEELAAIPPDQRLRMAVGERLWDRCP